MAQTVATELAPYSFMALLAAEGQIPHTTSAPAKPLKNSVSIIDRVRAVTSDVATEGDFFTLMEENNQMRPLPKKRLFNFKIVRPVSLGGDFPTNLPSGGAYA